MAKKRYGKSRIVLLTGQELLAMRLLAEKLKEIARQEVFVQMTSERYAKLKQEVLEEMKV